MFCVFTQSRLLFDGWGRNKGKMSQIVDKNGRIIPTENERVYSLVDRKYFCLHQPEITLSRIYNNFVGVLGKETLVDLSEIEFKKKFENLVSQLKDDTNFSNLLKGVYVPFILPKKDSLGKNPITSLVEAAGKSFKGKFPQFDFKLISDVKLDSDLEIRQNSSWELLDIAWSQGSVVGIYFPTTMSGFAIPDYTSVVSRLHRNNLVLSGIPEVASAIIGSPDLLIKRDGKYPNLLALAAFIERDAVQKHFFHFFEAYGWNLYFNRRSYLGAVSEYYSGGLTFVNTH